MVCRSYGLSAVSCAKTAEPIEMQFAMQSQMGPGNHALNGRCRGNDTFGVSGGLIVKQDFGVG